MSDLLIYVRCTGCNDGNVLKQFKEFEINKDGVEILVDKEEIESVSFSLSKDQLKDMTISEFVADKPCRKCRSKKLVEVVN